MKILLLLAALAFSRALTVDIGIPAVTGGGSFWFDGRNFDPYFSFGTNGPMPNAGPTWDSPFAERDTSHVRTWSFVMFGNQWKRNGKLAIYAGAGAGLRTVYGRRTDSLSTRTYFSPIDACWLPAVEAGLLFTPKWTWAFKIGLTSTPPGLSVGAGFQW